MSLILAWYGLQVINPAGMKRSLALYFSYVMSWMTVILVQFSRFKQSILLLTKGHNWEQKISAVPGSRTWFMKLHNKPLGVELPRKCQQQTCYSLEPTYSQNQPQDFKPSIDFIFIIVIVRTALKVCTFHLCYDYGGFNRGGKWVLKNLASMPSSTIFHIAAATNRALSIMPEQPSPKLRYYMAPYWRGFLMVIHMKHG